VIQTILHLQSKTSKSLKMEQEQTLNPKESLELITDVINKTKENINHYSFVFLLWGWFLAIASVIRFLLAYFTEFKYPFLPFPVLSAIAIIISIVFYTRKKITYAETYLSFFLKRLWAGVMLGSILLVFACVVQKIQPSTFTLILGGIGTLITGQVIKFRPLQIGGALLLISSIVCCFIVDDYKFLMVGLAIIPGYLIPGYLLKKVKP
jgi:hypothetical protein